MSASGGRTVPDSREPGPRQGALRPPIGEARPPRTVERSSTLLCSGCQHENADGARFCNECGNALVPRCPACGEENPQKAKFCAECGRPLTSAKGKTRPVTRSAPPSPRDYTPAHLAEQILKSRAAIEGERKQVTVLFADLKGSMELSEEMGPELWHGVLDAFFEHLADGIHRFEGTINQYTGDGVMALFGAPIAHEDHAQRACFAALHLQQVLRRFADELRRTEGVSLSTRIGINSGEVVVGRIGDDLRMDYTAQGHTVGLAQRMEARAAADSTYVSEHTARLVEGYFDLRPLGAFELKGVSEPTEVFELEGLGKIKTRLERSRERGFSRFVGRGDEVAALDLALESALEGRGGVVGVVAEAGVGKSRLCAEFLARARAKGIATYEGHCPSHGRAVPLLPALELMRAFFGVLDSDGEQQTREKIAGRLLLLDRELESFLPLSFEFFGVPEPGAPPSEEDPRLRQRRLLLLAQRLVQARSDREPAVLLVDDCHWIDEASDEFLAALVEVVPQTRTVLLLNFRPEYGAEWMSRSTYQQLPLRPLGDDAVQELLLDLLGDDPSLESLSPVVKERSGGNPFYVEEIVHNLVEQGSLEGERGRRRLVAPIERLEVPRSVQAILAARIDRLPEVEKTLLQTASALGRQFQDSILREVSGLGETEFDEALRALVRAEFIYAEVLYPEAEYAFRHPLTHEVAENSQLSDRRRQVHAEVARALERRCESDAQRDERSALLAHHYDEANERVPAALWHRRAAEWIEGSNSKEASRHWHRVRALSDEIEDAALANELGERSRLMVLEYSWRIGASEAQISQLLEEGEAWAARVDDPHALALLYNAASMPLVLNLGQLDRCREITNAGLAAVEGAGDRGLEFSLRLRAALVAEYTGDGTELARSVERLTLYSVDEMEAASSLVGYDASIFARILLALSERYAGRLALSQKLLAEVSDAAQQRDATEVASWIRAFRAAGFYLTGELERAIAIGRQGTEIAESVSELSIAFTSLALAEPLAAAGRIEEARTLALRGLDFAERSCRPAVAPFWATRSLCELLQGNGTDARRSAEKALAQARALGGGDGRVKAGFAAARVAIWAEAAPQEAEARSHLDACAAFLHSMANRHYLPLLHELEAGLAFRLGDTEAQRRQLDEARRLALEIGAGARADALAQQLRQLG